MNKKTNDAIQEAAITQDQVPETSAKTSSKKVKAENDDTDLNFKIEHIKTSKEVMEEFGDDADAMSIATVVPNIDESIQVTMMKGYSKTIVESLVNVGFADIRVLVDTYYQGQKTRIALNNQIKAIESGKDDGQYKSLALRWIMLNKINEEVQIKKMLDNTVETIPIGRWLLANSGIGPMISAGLISYFKLDKPSIRTAGSFWSYAGLNDKREPYLGTVKASEIVTEFINKASPEITTEKLMAIGVASGRSYEKIRNMVDADGNLTKTSIIKKLSMPPYNIALKMLCWKVGESFKYLSSNPKSKYGAIYIARKDYETALNKSGKYKLEAIIGIGYITRAKAELIRANEVDGLFDAMMCDLKNKNFKAKVGVKTKSYQAFVQGMLSDSHIVQRAKRYTTKLFVSHLFEAMWIDKYQSLPVIPYVIAYGGHKDYIEPEVPYDMLWRNCKVQSMQEKVNIEMGRGTYVPGGINRTLGLCKQPEDTNVKISWAWVKEEVEKIKEIISCTDATFSDTIETFDYTPEQTKLINMFFI